ncbi:uncharacterized protein DUF3142 [Fluviicoccus keumensis]|uniref:Uncharacterized protein DUF3142 n=1 Tax=Fluviicoccus keumensis TaxID=1435465 RepID=A0A4Q7YH91_9GAMM|nr:DUF3142 domain-containing protein [Fluviicoccus keumensis]RZU36872.1 uncharacterized protein DUF3142 [Fluviicoccus keumensis]
MKRIAWLAAALLVAQSAFAAVQAGDYRQFWLWAGVRAQPEVLRQAQTLYVLQGEISGTGPSAELHIQGINPVRLATPEVWLSWRVQRLDWTPDIVKALARRAALWRHRGSRVAGIQIDFDARSLRLGDYAAFLRQLRQQLPTDCRLGITGLLDWTQTGDVDTLNRLQGVVDEIVVQTYRGRRTEPGYERYLDSLSRLDIPFKIGLVQDGDWDSGWQDRLRRLPAYRGEVIFLLNSRIDTAP